jgi:hypothetical protein
MSDNGVMICAEILVVGFTTLLTVLFFGTDGIGYVNNVPQHIIFSFIYDPLVLIISLIICTEIRYLSIPKTPLNKNETVTDRVISEKVSSFMNTGWMILVFYNIITAISMIWLLLQNAMPSIQESLPKIIDDVKLALMFIGAFIGIYLFLYAYIKVNSLKYRGYKK